MFALRERRIHVTQEDFEMAVGKVMNKVNASIYTLDILLFIILILILTNASGLG